MQSHRLISGLTVVLMVVLVAAGWFLVAQPQLAAADTANTQILSAQSQIATSQAALSALKRDQQKLPELRKTLDALKQSIPSDVDSSSYIRGLNDLASASGVTITAIKVNDPQAYVSPAAPAPAAGSAGGASASPSPSPTASASPAAAPAPTGWTPTTSPIITGSNFVVIPVTVTSAGLWDNTLSFLHGLQTGKRLFLVTGLSTSHRADDPNTVNAEISGYIYVIIDPKLGATSTKSGASASPTPTPTPTPTVSSSPNPSGSSTPTPTTSPTP